MLHNRIRNGRGIKYLAIFHALGTKGRRWEPKAGVGKTGTHANHNPEHPKNNQAIPLGIKVLIGIKKEKRKAFKGEVYSNMLILCILGKSGTYKAEILKELSLDGYTRLVSYTTRSPRENEINHEDYHFITDEKFDELVSSDIIIEWVTYNNKKYGLPRPVGSSTYAAIVTPSGLSVLKGIYKNQTFSVYLEKPSKPAIKPPDPEIQQADAAEFKNMDMQVDYILQDSKKIKGQVNKILTQLHLYLKHTSKIKR